MKIQCNVCGLGEATLLCCADEATLCCDCDHKVHAANKLATKHQRLSLSHSSSIPNCDICQEAVGYFFCLEDRALLCRKCDVAIHTANTYVLGHQRFLLTGVKVGLEPVEPGSSSSGCKTQSGENASDAENHTDVKRSLPTSTTSHYGAMMSSKRSMPMSTSNELQRMQPIQSGTLEDVTQSRMVFAGGSAAGNLSQWPIDEYVGLSDFQQNYGFADNGSSKCTGLAELFWPHKQWRPHLAEILADSGKLGESDSGSFLWSLDDDLLSDERFGQVPDETPTTSKLPSPPTASGLHWPRNSQHLVENAAFVPDIGWVSELNNLRYVPSRNGGKRRREL